jgi:hypothetical protein
MHRDSNAIPRPPTWNGDAGLGSEIWADALRDIDGIAAVDTAIVLQQRRIFVTVVNGGIVPGRLTANSRLLVNGCHVIAF